MMLIQKLKDALRGCTRRGAKSEDTVPDAQSAARLTQPQRTTSAALDARAASYDSTRPLHAQHDIRTNAQPGSDAFAVSIVNDPEAGTYTQKIEGDYSALMYSALMLVEYMGHQDERQVMVACARLVNAAKMYGAQRRARLDARAQVLFTGADVTGVLDRDFL